MEKSIQEIGKFLSLFRKGTHENISLLIICDSGQVNNKYVTS